MGVRRRRAKFVGERRSEAARLVKSKGGERSNRPTFLLCAGSEREAPIFPIVARGKGKESTSAEEGKILPYAGLRRGKGRRLLYRTGV